MTKVSSIAPKVTKVSSIAIELNSSRGTFSSIAIELKIEGQRALMVNIIISENKSCRRTA